MKKYVFGLVAAGFLLPLLVLVVILGSDTDESNDCGAGTGLDGGTEALILATIRHRESGNNYEAINRGDGEGGIASGAYQFVTGTWDNWSGYTDAYLAPPEVQDEKARDYLADAMEAINSKGLDWTYVPVFWYYPSALGGDLNFVPAANEGNTQTLAEYRDGWLADYARIESGEQPFPASASDPSGIAGTPCSAAPGVPIAATNGVALPLAGFPRDIYDSGHHSYPAIDIMIPTGTPVYAWHGGTVQRVTNWDGNCGARGFNSDTCPATCGIGVTVRDETWADMTWTYCHLSARTVNDGDPIVAGQNLGVSGNTGMSGADHLHIEFRFNGTKESRVCPQPLLLQIFDQPGTLFDPHTLPRLGAGC